MQVAKGASFVLLWVTKHAEERAGWKGHARRDGGEGKRYNREETERTPRGFRRYMPLFATGMPRSKHIPKACGNGTDM